MKSKVLAVIGARPQFVKAAAIQAALGERRRSFDWVWVHTGQHYDRLLSDVFFEELKLPRPKYNLKVGSMPHGRQTALMIERLERVFEKEKPSAVLVFGDTNSTLAAALAAAKLRVPVAHVEAGVRSFNRSMPEEVNRVVTDAVSSLFFCPTAEAVRNLRREGVTKGLHVTGDVMADLVRTHRGAAAKAPFAKPYYLATVHRDFNTDDPRRLSQILEALAKLEKPVVFPVHPRTRAAAARSGLRLSFGALRAVEPLSYLKMLAAERHAKGIITDSGGIQKEAFLLGVPCVTLREETEWTETLRAGANRLCPPDARAIRAAFSKMKRRSAGAAYGSGSASKKILDVLERFTEARRVA